MPIISLYSNSQSSPLQNYRVSNKLLLKFQTRIRLLIAVFLVLGWQEAQSQLSGALSGSLGPGSFTVVGHISVAAGDSLRLQPGTNLNFVGVYRFEIFGTLKAEGTPTDSIRFTCDTSVVVLRWRKLRFFNATSSGSRLSYCVIEHARGTDVFPQLNGGGVFCSASSPVFEHCVFRRNKCDLAGGGVYCTASSAIFRDCLFESNVATGNGGGISLQSNSTATLERCLFIGNSATLGGGAITQTSSNAIFRYCRFLGNHSTTDGGGVYVFGASPQILDCHIRYNEALGTGGGLAALQSTLLIEHCSVDYNNSDTSGGSVYLRDASPRLISSLIMHSNDFGLFIRNCPSAQIEYCDLFAHPRGNIGFHNGSPSQGPAGLGVKSTRNTNRDSCDSYFNIQLDPIILDTAGGVYTFDPCTSPMFGAGKPLPTSTADALGNIRPDPAGSAPEIGAYEDEYEHKALRGVLNGVYGPGRYLICDSVTVVYPDSARLLAGTTFQFADSFRFILTGRLLAEGTQDDSIRFTADTLTNPRKWRGLRFTNQNSSGSRLRYCVIENGRATGSSANQRGGGVYCSSNSNPLFTNCVIRRCRADQFGGGVYTTTSSPVFTSCLIERCNAGTEGGAFYLTNSSPQVSFCTISGNSASGTGGAAWISSGSPQFMRNTVTGNSAPSQGGGVYMISTTANFNSNIVSHSTGIGVYFRSSASSVFRHNDVSNNSGGNIVLHSLSPIPPHAPAGIGIKTQVNANGDSSDVYGNIQFDPLFLNRTAGDFHLQDGSACIDAGDPVISHDADNTVADIGAYFFDQTPPPPPARIDSIAVTGYEGTCDTDFEVGDTLCIYVQTDSNAVSVLLDFSCVSGLTAADPAQDSLWLAEYEAIGVNGRGWRGCLPISETIVDTLDSLRNVYSVAAFESDCQIGSSHYILNVRALNVNGLITEPARSYSCAVNVRLLPTPPPPPLMPAVIESIEIRNMLDECDSLFQDGDTLCIAIETDTAAASVLIDWSCLHNFSSTLPDLDTLLLTEFAVDVSTFRRLWQGCIEIPAGTYTIADSSRNSYIAGSHEPDCRAESGQWIVAVQAMNAEGFVSKPEMTAACMSFRMVETPQLPPDSAENVTISYVSGSVHLSWESAASVFYIYGADSVEGQAVLLDTVSVSEWTDPETETRPERFFYFVTAELP